MAFSMLVVAVFVDVVVGLCLLHVIFMPFITDLWCFYAMTCSSVLLWSYGVGWRVLYHVMSCHIISFFALIFAILCAILCAITCAIVGAMRVCDTFVRLLVR